MANGIWTLFVLANYKGPKSSELTTMIMLGNLSGSVSQRWNWADARSNSGSSLLAWSLMCHSFRSQRSLQHHTALRTVPLSIDNAHREPPHGHWGKYLCTYCRGTKNSHWDFDCGTFPKKFLFLLSLTIPPSPLFQFLPDYLFDFAVIFTHSSSVSQLVYPTELFQQILNRCTQIHNIFVKTATVLWRLF